MLNRRKALSSLTGFLGLGLGGGLSGRAALAQSSSEKPSCTAYKTVEGWTITSSIKKKDETYTREWKLRARTIEKTFTLPGYAVERVDSGVLNVTPKGDEIRLSFLLPKGRLTDPSLTVGDSYLLGRKVEVKLALDGDDTATLNNVDGFTHVLNAPDWFVQELRDSQRMNVTMRVDGTTLATLALDVSGYPNALAAGPLENRRHYDRVVAAGGCRASGGCVMTTAAVHMLGRADDCFELTQMRRLRARFAHQSDVLADYIAASNRLLSRPVTGARAAALMAFYAAVVWPTALLVRAGALRPARGLYLGGFALLKRAMGLPANR